VVKNIIEPLTAPRHKDKDMPLMFVQSRSFASKLAFLS